jgi:hypothetical protein
MADGSVTTLTNPVTGTGVNGRLAFWNGTNTITSDSDLLFNGNTLTLLTGNVEIAAGNGLILFNPNTTNYFQLYTNNGNELNFGFGGTTPVVAKVSSSGTMTLTGDIFIQKAAPSVQLRAGNGSNAGFVLANSSNTHNWTFESDFGAAGQQGELRIRNSILGSNAITISTSNAATFSSTLRTGGDISLMNASGDIHIRMKDSSGNADRVLLRQSGTNDVYVGDIDANNGRVIIRTNGNDVVTIASSGAANFASLGTGTVTATSGTLSTVSDSNYKIEDGFIDSAIDKVISLKPRYFYWNEKSGLPKDIRQLGFYAQEVNEALGEEAANTPKDQNTPWGISDRSMIAMLTKAIQELKQEIDTLKN